MSKFEAPSEHDIDGKLGNLSTIRLFINQQSLNSLLSVFKLSLSEQPNWIVAKADWKITSWLLISEINLSEIFLSKVNEKFIEVANKWDLYEGRSQSNIVISELSRVDRDSRNHSKQRSHVLWSIFSALHRFLSPKTRENMLSLRFSYRHWKCFSVSFETSDESHI